MSYDTELIGRFKLDKQLSDEHYAYLLAFQHTRRMKRIPSVAEKLPDPIRLAVGLPIGFDGAYFVGVPDGNHGQALDPSVVDSNCIPVGQFSHWCKWVPSQDRWFIEWNGGHSFRCYTEWLRYIVDHFIGPWGYILDGEVEWRGEEHDDIGKIVVQANIVTELEGRVVYE